MRSAHITSGCREDPDDFLIFERIREARHSELSECVRRAIEQMQEVRSVKERALWQTESTICHYCTLDRVSGALCQRFGHKMTNLRNSSVSLELSLHDCFLQQRILVSSMTQCQLTLVRHLLEAGSFLRGLKDVCRKLFDLRSLLCCIRDEACHLQKRIIECISSKNDSCSQNSRP